MIWPAVAALGLAVLVGACERQVDKVSADPATLAIDAGRAVETSASAPSWGTVLLGFVPERGDLSIPPLARIRGALKACIDDSQTGEGKCGLSGPSPAAADAASVRVRLDGAGADARVVRLSACCSADPEFFSPFQNQPVIRTELICSEMTFDASESVKAFRVVSPGKRDFVYAVESRSMPSGLRVDLTMLLSPVESGEECVAISSAHAQSEA